MYIYLNIFYNYGIHYFSFFSNTSPLYDWVAQPFKIVYTKNVTERNKIFCFIYNFNIPSTVAGSVTTLTCISVFTGLRRGHSITACTSPLAAYSRHTWPLMHDYTGTVNCYMAQSTMTRCQELLKRWWNAKLQQKNIEWVSCCVEVHAFMYSFCVHAEHVLT